MSNVASGAPAAGGSSPTPQAAPGGRIPAGAGVHGVTDDAIQIGITTYNTEAVTALATAGGYDGSGGESSFSYDKSIAAVVDLINGLGGIAGRTVEPVLFSANAGNYVARSTRDQESQSACAAWTEDNQVFAIHPAGASGEVMLECAKAAKTPIFESYLNAYPSQRRFSTMAEYFYTPSGFVSDRRERAMAEFLLQHDFFPEGAKVGLMIEDRPGVREGVENELKPRLAAAGIKPTAEIVFPDGVESPWQNYVLQMQSAGVTHVLFSAGTIGLFSGPLFMMRSAEEQQYRPKWAISTDTWPALMPAFGGPTEQMANAFGMGWKPIMDTLDTSFQSPNAELCGAALKKHGQPENNDWAWVLCDSLLFLRAAFEHATEVSPAGLAAGAARLGTGYRSTVTPGGATAFGAGRHDGVSHVRPISFDRSRNNFVYSGPAQPVTT